MKENVKRDAGNSEAARKKLSKQASQKAILQTYRKGTSALFPLGAPIQLATTIKHETENFTYTDDNGDEEEQEVGTFMNAHLDPADDREGSAPGGELDNLMTALAGIYPHQRMIRGHLLNGNLGGLGIAANLFPITNRANRLHETQVENHIKQEIKDLEEVDYKVTVNGNFTEDDADAVFHCEATRTSDGAKIIDKNIESYPGNNRRNSADFEDLQEDDDDNLSGGRKFINATLPGSWGERGSGRRGELRYSPNGRRVENISDGSLHARIN
jgi:hypothetical protein